MLQHPPFSPQNGSYGLILKYLSSEKYLPITVKPPRKQDENETPYSTPPKTESKSYMDVISQVNYTS